METVTDKIIKMIGELPNVKPEDIKAAIDLQRRKGITLSNALVEKGLIGEKDLLVMLVRELHIPSIDLSKYRFDKSLKTTIPEKIARQYHIIPISQLGETITIALSDPFNVFAIDDLKNITGKEIDLVIATDSQVRKAIDNYYGAGEQEKSVSELSKKIDIEDFEIVSESNSGQSDVDADSGEQAPIIRMVNALIKEALRQRASDIHLEPTGEGVRVRYRIDGILQDITTIPKENQNSVVVRIKIMSRLDITSNQVPQDGRFKMRFANQEVDFRVSMLPTLFGQKTVMRVLDKKNLSIGMETLGFSPHSIQLLEEAIAKPFGMILVTGPTGSGKSTTLYSIINKLNTVDRNIITVEDPVEYLMDGLTQIEVKPDIGLTFASGLKAILRQSPDIVMVGEIRDQETADIAIKASLTGQMVYSTLHTNDAPGALTRLVDMGVESFLVASSLVLVCAQRLARRICPHCKQQAKIPDQVWKKLKDKVKSDITFYEGKGCNACRGTGYLGRLGITEILQVDDQVRELLLQGKSSDDIKHYAQQHLGMKVLWDDILYKIGQGSTTVTELFRIASED